jgi:hypothetical protein
VSVRASNDSPPDPVNAMEGEVTPHPLQDQPGRWASVLVKGVTQQDGCGYN